MAAGRPRISLVAALDRRRAIGRDNAMPWHLPDDLRRFKRITLGKPVLMGRRTAESLGRALPGRDNLVLTRSGQVPFDGMRPIGTLDDALALDVPELCVIGGGEIYALTLPLADVLHLTHVDTEAESADAFFPEWDDGGWIAGPVEHHPADARHALPFDFVDYTRVVDHAPDAG